MIVRGFDTITGKFVYGTFPYIPSKTNHTTTMQDFWFGVEVGSIDPITIEQCTTVYGKEPDKCVKCGCIRLSPLSSIQKKKCTGCGYENDWVLKEGQAPAVSTSRDKRKSKQ